jgi:hypothetical protein
MSNGDFIVPPTDLTTAAIAAVNLILHQFHVAPLDLLLAAFAGRPKFEDTNNVIAAYHQSAYGPLNALASDLAIAEKNGAPISDSNPAIQAQFGVWKKGTVTSIQALAGVQEGEGGPGFWTLFNLILKSWAASGDGENAVLQYVKAIDAITIVLSQQAQQSQGGGGGGGGGGGKPPPPPPGPDPTPTCESLDPDTDEPYDSCRALYGQLHAILGMLQGMYASQTGQGIDPCCAKVATAIASVTGELTVIAQTLMRAGKPVDLSPITGELAALVAAVNAYPPAAAAVGAAIGTHLDGIAAAIAKLAPGAPVDVSGIVEQLKRRNDDLQVDAAWKKTLIDSGVLPPEMVPLIQATTTDDISATMAGLLGYLFALGVEHPDDKAIRFLKSILKPMAISIWTLLKDTVAFFKTGDSSAATGIADAAKALVGGLDGAVVTLFGGAANLIIKGYESGIDGIDTTTDAGVDQVIQILMGRAFELGMGAHIMATLPELAYFTKQIGFNRTAALMAEMAGFHEIMIQAHRPFMTAALGRPATYSTNRKYRNTLPGAALGMTWSSRRILHDADAAYLASSAGFNDKWQAPMMLARYHPVSPRAIATAIADTPFPKAELQDILEDNGYSPAHVAFMMQVLEYNSTKNVRNAFVSEAITAYKDGVMPDVELDDILTSVGWSDVAKQFVRSRALLQRRVTLAAEAEKFILPEVEQGNMSPATGRQQLAAAGVEPWKVDLQITLATTKASIHKTLLSDPGTRKLEELREKDLTDIAVSEFHGGLIDDLALAAKLALIPLPLTHIASIVAVQNAKRKGNQRVLWGQTLDPQAAKLLEERIAAIAQQTKDQLITLDQAAAELATLKVDPLDANALVARWAATLKKSAGVSQLITP